MPCAERVFEQMKEELSDATLRYEMYFSPIYALYISLYLYGSIYIYI